MFPTINTHVISSGVGSSQRVLLKAWCSQTQAVCLRCRLSELSGGLGGITGSYHCFHGKQRNAAPPPIKMFASAKKEGCIVNTSPPLPLKWTFVLILFCDYDFFAFICRQ